MPAETTLWRARRQWRLVLTFPILAAAGLAAIALGLWGQHAGLRRSLPLLPAGVALLGLSLYGLLATLLRYPRLIATPQRLRLARLHGADWAEWTSLGPFHAEPRPFGMDFGNDRIAASITGTGLSAALLKEKRVVIALGLYDAAPNHILATLNAYRAQACGAPAGAAALYPPPAPL